MAASAVHVGFEERKTESTKTIQYTYCMHKHIERGFAKATGWASGRRDMLYRETHVWINNVKILATVPSAPDTIEPF